MRTKEMRESIRIKNGLLIRQTKRIELLEEKMTELRKKYFQLKHSNLIVQWKELWLTGFMRADKMCELRKLF